MKRCHQSSFLGSGNRCLESGRNCQVFVGKAWEIFTIQVSVSQQRPVVHDQRWLVGFNATICGEQVLSAVNSILQGQVQWKPLSGRCALCILSARQCSAHWVGGWRRRRRANMGILTLAPNMARTRIRRTSAQCTAPNQPPDLLWWKYTSRQHSQCESHMDLQVKAAHQGISAVCIWSMQYEVWSGIQLWVLPKKSPKACLTILH